MATSTVPNPEASTRVVNLKWRPRSIDRVSDILGKAWALCVLVRAQFNGEVPENSRCDYIWTSAVIERVAELVRSAEDETAEAPHDVAQLLHVLRAQCEVLLSDRSTCGDAKQHLSNTIMDWLLGALADDLKRAKEVVDESGNALAH